MKLIQSLIIAIKNRLFKETYVPTGRWCQNLSQPQLIRRIELANEDHCGPCGHEALDMYIKKNEEKLKELQNKVK